MEPVICIDPLFPGKNDEEKIKITAESGFRFIEFWDWHSRDIEKLKTACRKHNVEIANFNGHRKGSLTCMETHQDFLDDLSDAVKTAGKLGCTSLMLLSDALDSRGQVADLHNEIPASVKYSNSVKALKKADAAVPAGINLLLEPLNTLIDHPGNFLNDMETAISIVTEAGSARIKVLCDLYHLGIMGFNPSDIVKKYLPHIGYFHIADYPGRHEPGTGKADWQEVLRLIRGSGYKGFVGFEFFPLADGKEALRRIRQLWESL